MSEMENGSSPKQRRKSRHAKSQMSNKYGTVRWKEGVAVEDVAMEMLDNDSGEHEQDFRGLAMTLRKRRAVRDTVVRNQEKPGNWKQFKYRVGLSKKRIRNNVTGLMYNMRLWRGLVKKIEGKFGSSVAAYFIILRWLFVINIPIFLLILGFIVIPQVVYRWTQQSPPGYTSNIPFSGWDLLTGGGWFRETEMYYGYYYNDSITASDYQVVNGSYNYTGSIYTMPYAYFFTMAAYFIVNAIILGASLLVSHVGSMLAGGQESSVFFALKVFCEWDFSVCRSDTAKLRHRAIYTELKEHLASRRRHDSKLTCGQRCELFILRLTVNIVVIVTIAAAAWLVWLLSMTQSLNTTVLVLSDLAMPLVFTAIIFIVPLVFSALTHLERYRTPQTAIYVTIARSVLLIFATFGVLIAFWFNRVSCELNTSQTNETSSCIECWETFIGEQIYRLMLVNFVFMLLYTLLAECVHSLMAKMCRGRVRKPQFDIAHALLILVYCQMLVWFGTFYYPLLGLMMLVEMFIMFYVRGASVLANCALYKKPWRAVRTHNVVVGLLCIVFMYCLLAVGYSIGFMTPSRSCGPLTSYSTALSVVNGLLSTWHAEQGADVIKTIVEIIASSAFSFFVFVCLTIGAYYCYIAVDGYKEVVEVLASHLQMSKSDRAFFRQWRHQLDDNDQREAAATNNY